MSSVKLIILNLKRSAGAFRQLIKQLQLCSSKTFSCLQERNPSTLLLSQPFPVNLQQKKIFTHTFEHVYYNVGFCFFWIPYKSKCRQRWPLTCHSSSRQTVKCVFSCVQSPHLFLFLLMVWFVSYLFSLSTGSYLNCELTFADGYTKKQGFCPNTTVIHQFTPNCSLSVCVFVGACVCGCSFICYKVFKGHKTISRQN